MIQKDELRKILKSALREKFTQSSPDEIRSLSLAALENLVTIPPLRTAKMIMLYIELPCEFPITPFFVPLLNHPARRVVIPWCDGNRLRLFRLASSDEVEGQDDFRKICFERLAPGAFGIQEPKESFRLRSEFLIEPQQLDLVIMPGLGFDTACRRLGRGKGYYDRFVTTLRSGVPLAGVCFDEQIIETVPTEPHDRSLDYVVTPTRVCCAKLDLYG